MVVNFKPHDLSWGAVDKIKGYGVKLACKPYPFVLAAADVIGVKFTRNSQRPSEESFCGAFLEKRQKPNAK